MNLFKKKNYDDYNDMDFLNEEEIEINNNSIFKPKNKTPNFVVSVLINTIRVFFVICLCAAIAIVGIVVGIGKAYVETAPNLDVNLLDNQAKTSFIYDSNGKLLTDYKGIENRVKVGIQYIPKNVQNAFIAVEDARFRTHKGIDVKRILGAFVNNFTRNTTQGGSTITQQLIKNTVLSNEISYKRKIQEAYLALQLEQKYSKDQILEAYLNTIYLGENYYGVKVAARGYFDKELHELTLRESAMLASVTSNPYYYNPYRNFYVRNQEQKDYVKITNDRTDYVLRQMLENHLISKTEYDEALNTSTANVSSKKQNFSLYQYPHYIEYAINEAIDALLKIKNLENTPQNRQSMENDIRTGGYHIKLAIDPEIQTIVEDTLQNWNKYPATADKNDAIFRVKNSDGTFEEIVQPQAAAAVLDYRTGELKAIVGGRTKPTQQKTLNRAHSMNMPIGSTIKPIAVFAPAIDTGAGPASIVYNLPIPIEGWLNDNKENSFPKNYGGGSYNGVETMREALRKSHNTSTASAFSMFVGTNKSVDYLHRLGVDSKNINATPFGLALGSSGITPIQLSTAYGVFANAGVYQEPISVLGISDSNGNVIFDAHKEQRIYQAVQPSTAWLITDILKDAIQHGTGVNAQFKGQTLAGKTGTNSDHRGVTFAGYSGYYSSAIWVGHDNYKPLSSKATGGGTAGAIWKNYMEEIHKKKSLPNKDILSGDPSDYGLVKVATCPVSGQLATEECYHDHMGRQVVTDWWPANAVPQDRCQMHTSITICRQSGMPVGPNCPQEDYVNASGIVIPPGHPLYKYAGTQYEEVIRQYIGDSVSFGSNIDLSDPSNQCNVHTSSTISSLPQSVESNNSIINEANTLLQQANLLLTSNQNHPNINLLVSAISNLQNQLQNNPSDAMRIYTFMLELTNTMGQFY